MPNIKYHFALEGNKIIPIEMVDKNERHAHTYTCMGCGAEMTAKMGNKNAWHFAHKVQDEGNCSSETYLHKLAKRLIREKFESSPSFWIQYNQVGLCLSYKECRFKYKQEDSCQVFKTVKHDLKQYYDLCQEEIPIEGFIADLLLSSSTHADRNPVLIEIYVTHKSTEEKLKSGLRIIEIKIDNEDSIKNLLTKDVIEEIYIEDKGDAYFYNFKKDPKEIGNRNIFRYILTPTGEARSIPASCHDINKKVYPNSIFEVTMNIDIFRISRYYEEIFNMGNYLATQHLPDFKTCELCKHYKVYYDIINDELCSVPKGCLFHNEDFLKNNGPIFAKQCPHHSPNMSLINKLKYNMPEFIIAK